VVVATPQGCDHPKRGGGGPGAPPPPPPRFSLVAETTDGLVPVAPDLHRAEAPEQVLHGHGDPEVPEGVGRRAARREAVEHEPDDQQAERGRARPEQHDGPDERGRRHDGEHDARLVEGDPGHELPEQRGGGHARTHRGRARPRSAGPNLCASRWLAVHTVGRTRPAGRAASVPTVRRGCDRRSRVWRGAGIGCTARVPEVPGGEERRAGGWRLRRQPAAGSRTERRDPASRRAGPGCRQEALSRRQPGTSGRDECAYAGSCCGARIELTITRLAQRASGRGRIGKTWISPAPSW